MSVLESLRFATFYDRDGTPNHRRTLYSLLRQAVRRHGNTAGVASSGLQNLRSALSLKAWRQIKEQIDPGEATVVVTQRRIPFRQLSATKLSKTYHLIHQQQIPPGFSVTNIGVVELFHLNPGICLLLSQAPAATKPASLTIFSASAQRLKGSIRVRSSRDDAS